MAELKTRPTDADVGAFIRGFADTERKQQDSLVLLALMRELSGCEPRVWGAVDHSVELRAGRSRESARTGC